MLYKQIEGGTQAGKSIQHHGKCDICGAPNQKVIFDAKIRPLSAWAWLCEPCFKTNGCQLGVGRGQKYEKEVDHEHSN